MKIVDQPLGRGGDGRPRIDGLGDIAVGRQSSTASLSASLSANEAPFTWPGVTACAAARLRACSSSRSTLNSSDRIGAPSSHGGVGPRAPSHRRNGKLSALLRRGLRRPAKSSVSTSMVLRPLQRGPGRRPRHCGPVQRPPAGAASSRDELEPLIFLSGSLGIGTLDNHFRALAMAADGVGQTVRLADRQVPRPEGRHHALIHPDGPAVLLFDNVESDHGMSPRMGCKELFQNSHARDECHSKGHRAELHRRPRRQPRVSLSAGSWPYPLVFGVYAGGKSLAPGRLVGCHYRKYNPPGG